MRQTFLHYRHSSMLSILTSNMVYLWYHNFLILGSWYNSFHKLSHMTNLRMSVGMSMHRGNSLLSCLLDFLCLAMNWLEVSAGYCGLDCEGFSGPSRLKFNFLWGMNWWMKQLFPLDLKLFGNFNLIIILFRSLALVVTYHLALSTWWRHSPSCCRFQHKFWSWNLWPSTVWDRWLHEAALIVLAWKGAVLAHALLLDSLYDCWDHFRHWLGLGKLL